MQTRDRDTLNKAGLKATPVRLSVLAALSTASHPLTVKGLLGELSKKGSSIDTVTIYRTLKSFEGASIVRSLSLGGDALSYELADDHHHHIVCLSCGLIEGFDECAFVRLGDSILAKSKKFKTISRHSFELFGTCSACAVRK
ncbi:MAG: Fur family transcriptional regulator [Candidatus Paceibacterota bacterium]